MSYIFTTLLTFFVSFAAFGKDDIAYYKCVGDVYITNTQSDDPKDHKHFGDEEVIISLIVDWVDDKFSINAVKWEQIPFFLNKMKRTFIGKEKYKKRVVFEAESSGGSKINNSSNVGSLYFNRIDGYLHGFYYETKERSLGKYEMTLDAKCGEVTFP